MAWWGTHLNVLTPVGKLEVLFLGLAQFALEAFFMSRATELASGVLPMAGPMVFDGVARGWRVWCI